jgi:hypothetical protein
MRIFSRFGVCAVFCATSAIFGQTVSASHECDPKPVKAIRIVKPGDGWALDFIDSSKVLSTSAAPSVYGPGQNIIQTKLGTKEDRIVLSEIVINPCDYTATLKSRFLRVMQVSAFSKAGKTFAYVVMGAEMAGPEPGATEFGSAIFVTFLDVHGNGRFEVMRTNGAPLPELPDWIK